MRTVPPRLPAALLLAAGLMLGGCGDDGEFCGDYYRVASNAPPLGDVDAMADKVSDFEELAERAPAEIRPEFVTTATGFREIIEAGDDPQLQSQIDMVAFEAATDRIKEWADTSC